jgi:hypothetical protein
MWGWIKDKATKAKNTYGWVKFVADIISAIGGGGLITAAVGLMVTIISIIGALLRALPWPFVLMAGFCTLVGVVYLAMASLAFKVLLAAKRASEEGTPGSKPAQQPIAPHYDAWKHVDRFTIKDAAFLWNDLEPNVRANFSSKVSAWIEAFQNAVRRGEIKIVSRHSNPRLIESEKANADSATTITRQSLLSFANKNGHNPTFLSKD